MESNNKSGILRSKEGADQNAEEEKISLGTIVSSKAHPYQQDNSSILITTYAHFTPPLMIVIEKNYGAKFSTSTGHAEDNDAYKCLYYSTANGNFESNWFKQREIRLISPVNDQLSNKYKSDSLEEIKKNLLGKMAILTSVDLELDKKKIWSDDEDGRAKMKTNNLLDSLPPLGSIIDVKANDDPQKFQEKTGHPIHKKSKFLAKLRWFNNSTSKYSEEYVAFNALKIADNELRDFKYQEWYLLNQVFELEDSDGQRIVGSPIRLTDILWKHYYYVYRFENGFSSNLQSIFLEKALKSIKRLHESQENALTEIEDNAGFEYKKVLNFFKGDNSASFENKWLQIEYSDRNEKYSKRIIYVRELIIEITDSEPLKERILLKSNCLLRGGKIRHFNVLRILGYKILEKFQSAFAM